MKIWYLGDSILSPIMVTLGQQLNLEVVDSSCPNAIMENVWTDQVYDPNFKGRKKPDCYAILFINNSDYDSEVLIWSLISKVTEASKIILVVIPSDAKAAEGLSAHWEIGDRFKLVRLNNLDEAVQAITQALTENANF